MTTSSLSQRAARSAGGGGAWWVGIVTATALWTFPAAAHERYARQEGLSCATCHLRDDGGPLTPMGRNYRWSGAAAELASAAGADSSPFGNWSGEASFFGRTAREKVRGSSSTQTSLTESLRLQGADLFGSPALSFQAEGLVRSTFATNEGFDEDRAHLVQAELDWRPSTRTEVRLGRHWLTAGVGVHHLDGVSVTRQVYQRVQLQAYGGIPVDNGFGGAGGDFLVGGRLGYEPARWLRTGVSTYYQEDSSDPADHKYGLDWNWTPHRTLEVLGHIFYDWIGRELYDTRGHVMYRPSLRWQFAADYSRTVPGLFLPKNSIFSVFSDDDYEETSLAVTHRFTDRLSLRIFERWTFYDDDSDVSRTGANLDLRYGPGGEDAVGAEVSYHDEERSGRGATRVDGDALFLRAYHLLYWTPVLYTSLDGSLQLYTGDSFGRDSTLGRLVVGYRPGTAWDGQVGVDYQRNPQFSTRFGFLTRLTYRF